VTSGTFRDLLGEPGCAVVPAVFDALSARIAVRLRLPRHDRLLAVDDYLALVGLPEYEALERRYGEGGDPPSS